MPTIFQICVEGNTGSTGRMAEAIGIIAIKNGWTSYIANGRFTRPSRSNLIRIGSDWDVFLHGLQTRFFDRHGLGSIRASKLLIKKILKIKPDLIHLHHLHGYYINIEILFDFLSKTSIPVVWTFHDCWSITGHCCHFDYIKCDKWKTECNHCPQRREYPSSLFIDRSRENYQLKKKLFTSVNKMTIVPVSNWLNSIVKQSFLGEVARQVIYNGVDIDLFVPQAKYQEIRDKYNIGNRFMILGVANTWGERKGLDDFIKLSKILSNNYLVVLVGLNKKQISALPPNILGITKTENQKELKDLYATADLFLNLSVEETFGFTTVEALSCGTPVVAYNATACPEIIDSKSGIVVNMEDLEGLLNAIDTVKMHGKDHYYPACRKRAVTLFNKDDKWVEYLDLYNRMIGVPD